RRSSRSRTGNWARYSVRPCPRRWRHGSTGGAGRFPSTGSGMSLAWRAPGRCCRGGSPWPVRPTTAWASPPAYARERTPQRRSGTTRWRVTHMNEPHTEATNAARLRELNATIRYTMWSVFRAARPLPADRERAVTEVTELLEQLAAKDVVVRGTYDVSALRA